MAVYGYCRVSTAEQAAEDRTSLAHQERQIRGAAMMRGHDVEKVFVDPGVSGSIPIGERPAGRELLSKLKDGDTIIVAKLDRAFRSAADALGRAEDWRRAGYGLVVADLGPDPVTDSGPAKLFFGMLALVAEFERDTIKARIKQGRDGKKARGGHIGGDRPFGYAVEGSGREARLVPIPEEQAALTTMRTARAMRMSYRRIAELVEVQHGLRCSHVTVRRALQRTQ